MWCVSLSPSGGRRRLRRGSLNLLHVRKKSCIASRLQKCRGPCIRSIARGREARRSAVGSWNGKGCSQGSIGGEEDEGRRSASEGQNIGRLRSAEKKAKRMEKQLENGVLEDASWGMCSAPIACTQEFA